MIRYVYSSPPPRSLWINLLVVFCSLQISSVSFLDAIMSASPPPSSTGSQKLDGIVRQAAAQLPGQPAGLSLYSRFAFAGAVCCSVTHGALTPVDVYVIALHHRHLASSAFLAPPPPPKLFVQLGAENHFCFWGSLELLMLKPPFTYIDDPSSR